MEVNLPYNSKDEIKFINGLGGWCKKAGRKKQPWAATLWANYIKLFRNRVRDDWGEIDPQHIAEHFGMTWEKDA